MLQPNYPASPAKGTEHIGGGDRTPAGPGARENQMRLCQQAASVHKVPVGGCFRKTDLPFGDSTKHLCSSAAQMFARYVILSTNKSRRKKKILEGLLYTLLGRCFKSNCHLHIFNFRC